MNVETRDSAASELLLLPRWMATVAAGRADADLQENAGVLIRAGRIVETGPSQTLLAKYPNAIQQALPNQLLIPGLVNAHTHSPMTLLRGVADDLALEVWLKERIWPLEAKLLSEQFCFDGAMLGAYEMLLGGVTSFHDMYFFPQASARAALAMGMRACVGLAVVDFSTPYGTSAGDYLRKGLECRDTFKGQDTLRFSLAPHAPYTVSDASFLEIAGLAAELGLPVQCHLHETAQELYDSIQQFGKRPLQRLEALGVLGPEWLAIHAVHVDENDIAILASNGVNVAHCPQSNLKLASGLAPTAALRRAGVRVGIGTDSSASNNRLDLFSEIRTAALLAKAQSGDASALNAHEVLRCATLDAAHGMGWADEIGSIEPGKWADLVTIDLSDSSLQPVYDPLAQLVYAAGREHVSQVWVAGEPVVIKRQLVSQRTQQALQEVTSRLGLWHNSIGEIVKAGQSHL